MPAVNVRVLVVDDETDVCQYMSALLNGAGIDNAVAAGEAFHEQRRGGTEGDDGHARTLTHHPDGQR